MTSDTLLGIMMGNAPNIMVRGYPGTRSFILERRTGPVLVSFTPSMAKPGCVEMVHGKVTVLGYLGEDLIL